MKKIMMLMSLLIFSYQAQAGIDDQLEDLFGAMTNVTAPGSASSQSRGVLSGGGVRVRWRTSNPALIGFKAPSASSSCNGLSAFGGSLSFINAEEFKQMLRNIGAAAGGYAFQLALQALCGQCASTLKNLQDEINKMNKHLRNSCQMGKFLVNKLDAFGLHEAADKGMRNESILQTSLGLDTFSGYLSDVNESVSKYLSIPGNNVPHKDNKVMQNVTKMIMADVDIKSWYSSGDAELEQMILSLTGMFILNVEDGSGGEKLPTQSTESPTIKIKDILNGGSVTLLKCDDDDCMNPTKEDKTIEGMYKRVSDLIGDSSSGIYGGFLSNNELLEKEVEFLYVSQVPVGAMIRNLARHGDSSSTIRNQTSKYIALQLVKELFDDILKNAYRAALKSKSEGAPKVAQMMLDRQQEIDNEYTVLADQMSATEGLFNIYDSLIRNTKKDRRAVFSTAEQAISN